LFFVLRNAPTTESYGATTESYGATTEVYSATTERYGATTEWLFQVHSGTDPTVHS